MDAAGASMNEMNASRPFQPAMLLLAASVVYGLLWPAVPGDINNFLIPWLDHILARGPIGAFAMPFSNYTPPYLYLLTLISPLVALIPKVSVIKLLSVGGTLLLALAVRHLMRSSNSAGRRDAWLWLMLLPSVAVNAANFGQCDAIWSAACVMAVASAVSDRPLAMLVWFGIAISFKAQGLFLGPFVALRLVQERTPLALWGVPAVVYVLCMLPAALAGWPLVDLATIYLRQTQWNPDFVSTAASPWSLVQYLAPTAARGWFWLGYVITGTAALAYVAAYRHRKTTGVDMIALALLGSCIMPFFLPKMHERFFFLAEVLSFVLAFSGRDRRSVLIFWLVQGAWVLAMAGAIFNAPLVAAGGGALILSAMLLLIDHLQPQSVRAQRGVNAVT